MKPLYWLAVVPFFGILLGPVFYNQVHPLILGMPFPLGWITVWVVITAIIMGIIYSLDPATEEGDPQ